MNKRMLCWIGCAIAVGAMVHVDWHIARPHHVAPLSGDCRYHWVTGLLTGAALAWMFMGQPHAVRDVALIGALGFLLGGVLEPIGEVVAYGDTWGQVFSPMRNRFLAQFAIAFVVGGSCVLIAAQRRRLAPFTSA